MMVYCYEGCAHTYAGTLVSKSIPGKDQRYRDQPFPLLLPQLRRGIVFLTEVATRLELVGPAVVRASLVLFSITYSYAVVAFAMYCSTPLGRESLESFKDDSMVKR